MALKGRRWRQSGNGCQPEARRRYSAPVSTRNQPWNVGGALIEPLMEFEQRHGHHDGDEGQQRSMSGHSSSRPAPRRKAFSIRAPRRSPHALNDSVSCEKNRASGLA